MSEATSVVVNNNAVTLRPLTEEMKSQEISVDVLLEKYAKEGEKTISDVRRRVAAAVAQCETDEKRSAVIDSFEWAMDNGFVPAGRINSAAGSVLKATSVNCFVEQIGDSITDSVDGMPSIYTALSQAAETMRKGGGVGYNFSHIRPNGAYVKGTDSFASGPLSYMKIFNVSCETVESAGSRRGAQMGMLNVDHPDILPFIRAKDNGDFKNFNLSVAVTDEFMNAVVNDTEFNLIHKVPKHKQEDGPFIMKGDAKWYIYEAIKARDLWEVIMKSTYDHAEPGIIFIDRVNTQNNLQYCETIEATNP